MIHVYEKFFSYFQILIFFIEKSQIKKYEGGLWLCPKF